MINVVVASSLSLLREGMKSLLLRHKDIRVAAEVAYMEDALAADAAVKNGVAVILAPLQYRDENTAALASSEWKHRRLITVTLGDDIVTVQAALQMGARGILYKSCTPDHILNAIRIVAENQFYVAKEIATLIATNLKSFSAMNAFVHLTQRELEILKRIAIGRRMSTIGRELGISSKTVSSHKANILDKLALTSDSELVLYAMENDLFDLFVDHTKRKKTVAKRTQFRNGMNAIGQSVIFTKDCHEIESGTRTHRRHRIGSVSGPEGDS